MPPNLSARPASWLTRSMAARESRFSREELEAFLAELESNPAMLARLREVSDGQTNPLDTLRWLLEPASLGTNGARNPRLAIPALERIVFAPPKDDFDRGNIAAATAKLQALVAETVEQDRALERALARLEEERVRSVAPVDDPAPGPEPIARKRWFVRPQLLALCAVAFLLAVFGVLALTQPRNSLAVFDRPQTAAEAALENNVPFRAFGVEPGRLRIDPGSMRILNTPDNLIVAAFLSHIPMIGSGSEASLVCASILWEEGSGITCTTEKEFHLSGLDLRNRGYRLQWGPTGDATLTDLNE